MTFCPFWKDCKNRFECGRALTTDVQKAADEFGLPIAYFVDKPEECFNPILCCERCGSTDFLRDAWVNGNDNKEVTAVHDCFYCNDCEMGTNPITTEEYRNMSKSI